MIIDVFKESTDFLVPIQTKTLFSKGDFANVASSSSLCARKTQA